MVTILACETNRQRNLFERVQETILKPEKFYVPPFPGSVSKIFKKGSPFLENGKLFPFIAFRDGKPVGRIAAIVNHAHNRFHQDKLGFFGFFDAVKDEEVASALFGAAENRLREEGLTAIRGPYNPSINDDCGVLTEGFDSPPFVMMPYNPSYYSALVQSQGLKVARTLSAFYLKADGREAPERILKIVNRVKRSTGVNLRTINMKNLDDELKIIHRLYNRTLDRNWGFVPITLEDLRFIAGDLKAIINPELVFFAEKDGEPVAFSLVFPNINQILWKIKNSPRWLRPLQFLWHLKINPPDEGRLPLLGVLPEYRNKGLGALFYAESLYKGRKSMKGGELSWIDEDNQEIMNGIRVMGGEKYKMYQIYEKALQ